VLFPELAHLRIGRRNRTEFPLLPLLLDQALRIQLAALFVAQPPPPLFDRSKTRLANLIAEVVLRGELLADVLIRLLHLIEHFLVRHLDRRIALRLLHQNLEFDQAVEDLSPEGGDAGGVRWQRLSLSLLLDDFLFDLRRENR